MAGRTARLSAWLVLAVVLAHGLVLYRAAQHLRPASSLSSMAQPMFTRVLQPQTPVIAQVQVAAPAPEPAKPKARKARIVRAQAAPKPTVHKATPSKPVTPPRPAAAATSGEDVIAQAPADAATVPPTDVDATPATDATTAPGKDVPLQEPPADPAAQPASASSGESGNEQPANSPAETATAKPQASDSDSTGNGTQPALTDDWPADTRLSYRLRGYFHGELFGSAQVQWQRQGSAYQTQVDIQVAVLLHQVLTSQGEVTAQGLAPRAYEETRPGKRRAVRLEGDTVLLEGGRSAARPEGVQDTASQFVELSHRFSSGREPLKVGHSVSMWMARPSGVDLWTYDIVERETLQTPGFGPVEAYRLKPRRVTNPGGNISAEIWYAPTLQYLPVRIRLNMGEDAYVDLMVEKIEQR